MGFKILPENINWSIGQFDHVLCRPFTSRGVRDDPPHRDPRMRRKDAFRLLKKGGYFLIESTDGLEATFEFWG